jgi:hypothetical protein
MTKSAIGAALAAGAFVLSFTVLPINSAEARVFKGGSSQRVGVVNPADPGKLTVPVPNTRGGGGGGGSASGGGGGGGGKTK